MSIPLRAAPRCSVCAAEAASIELLDRGDPRALSGPTLVVTFAGAHSTLLEDEAVAAITRALGSCAWRELFDIDVEYAPFYCPNCETSYCEREWTEELVWDEDDPGFLDATYGTCPRGHRRMLFD